MKSPYYIIDTPQDVELTIALLQKMQAVCAMRLHALVFSAAAASLLSPHPMTSKSTGYGVYRLRRRLLRAQGLDCDWLCNAIDNVMSQDSRRSGEAISHRLVELERENVCAARQLLGQGNS